MMSRYTNRPFWQILLFYAICASLVYWLIYYFFVVRQVGTAGTSEQPQALATPTPTPTPSEIVEFDLSPVQDSGVNGRVVLEAYDGKTVVRVTLAGAERSGPAQPAGIFAGGCPVRGSATYELVPSVAGFSTTTIPVTLASLLSKRPLSVNITKSWAQPEIQVACGQFPAN